MAYKLTKIICTIGPSSNDKKTIMQLIEAGMDVARLNFSHGSFEEHEEVFGLLRDLDPQLAIEIDIPGPKIRLGELPDKIYLPKGHKVMLTTRDITGTEEILPVGYKKLPEEVQCGSNIFINDGLVRLKVLKIENTEIECIVEDDGLLTSSHAEACEVPTSTERSRGLAKDQLATSPPM